VPKCTGRRQHATTRRSTHLSSSAACATLSRLAHGQQLPAVRVHAHLHLHAGAPVRAPSACTMECTPPALPFSGDGISLAALRLFLNEHAGKDFTADARWEAVRNHASAAGREPASSFDTLSVGK
jgi:hypothetical protein